MQVGVWRRPTRDRSSAGQPRHRHGSQKAELYLTHGYGLLGAAIIRGLGHLQAVDEGLQLLAERLHLRVDAVEQLVLADAAAVVLLVHQSEQVPVGHVDARLGDDGAGVRDEPVDGLAQALGLGADVLHVLPV